MKDIEIGKEYKVINVGHHNKLYHHFSEGEKIKVERLFEKTLIGDTYIVLGKADNGEDIIQVVLADDLAEIGEE